MVQAKTTAKVETQKYQGLTDVCFRGDQLVFIFTSLTLLSLR